MNRVIILLTIALFFASFVKSALQERQDPLNGFKQCEGKFPNAITELKIVPMPIIHDKPIKFHISGKATVAIEKGALMISTIYFDNQPGLLFEIDYCQGFVNPSGLDCPEKGDFSHSMSWSIPPHNNDEKGPSNVTTDHGMQMTVSNPDGQILSCLVGKIKVFHP